MYLPERVRGTNFDFDLIAIKSPLGRHFFIAQGGMRAKPEMKPWGHTEEKDELR